MKVKVTYVDTIEVEIDEAVVNEYLENNFDPDTETLGEYHRRSLTLEENIWKAIDEASGKSFLDFKDGPITGIYDENEDEIIVY
jgi:hypothetical protein